MTLHTTDLGDRGPRLVFCHGLFGQGRNWTQIAKAFASDHRVTLVDMPDHGRSDWNDAFDYLRAAEQVAELFSADDPVALVGHSMGGKIAMLIALTRPELVERLCVVDVSPATYGSTDEFRGYLDAMLGLDLDVVTRRDEVDAALRDAVRDDAVRSFLLQNLRRDGDSWRWQANLEVFRRDLEVLRGWPEEAVEGRTYDGPVLWIAGADSGYIRPEYAAAMQELFPTVRRVTIKGAGHWVHSEQPAIFTEVLRRFLAAGSA